MAKEYIDREEVLAWLDGLVHNMENRLIHTPKKDTTYSRFETRLAERKSIADAIRIKPAADVVEVVRCRDCKHFTSGGDGKGICQILYALDGRSCEDFCSRGERKDVQ